MFKRNFLCLVINVLIIVSIYFSGCFTVLAEDETVTPLQKFIVYSISLDENSRVAVTDILKTCILSGSELDKKSEKILPYIPDMTYEEILSALKSFSICTHDGANYLCDLILFGPTIPQYRDNMPGIISNLNYNIIGNKNDHRGSTFFYSLLQAYNLYTIFGGNPYIATNMPDLPGLIDINIDNLPYDISSKISTAINLMPSLKDNLEGYGQTTMLANLLKMAEVCANDESTEEIYYFKVSLDECGVFYGNWPSMRGNEKYDGLTFRDIDNCTWAHTAIKSLSNGGIINGYDRYRFAPSDNITREQFVKIVVTALGIDITNVNDVNFTDADKTAWYYPYICAAYNSNIINGETAKIFGVGNPVTREQMATIIYRAYTDAGISFETGEIRNFHDSLMISEYAKEAVEKMSSCSIITGMDGNMFAPGDFASRAQAAAMIERAENLKD